MTDSTLWTVIFSLGIGSFLLRFSFLGLVGKRQMPPWLLRHLRYTAVAILPALAAPLVVWPEGPGSPPDISQMLAATATILAGILTRSTLVAVLTGFAVLALTLVLG